MTTVYEFFLAPLVFALVVRHAQRALGAGRAALEVLALVVYVFAFELLGRAELGAGWRIALLGVPLAVPLLWASLILSALALAARVSLRTPLARGAATGLLCLTADLLIEPVATAEGLWRFNPAGAWLQVPLGSPLGRAVMVGAYAWSTERFSGGGSGLRRGTWRAFLAFLALGVVLAAGWLSSRPSGEVRLPAEAGWVAWSGSCLATLAVGLRKRWSALGTSLASRLGVVPGHGPGLVFVITAVVVATHAALSEAEGVRLAALVPAAVLVVAAGSDIHRAALDSWRNRTHGRLAGTESLVAVLMKRPNGQPWTREERAFLHAELRAVARYLPALLLFLLPGSMVLLPLYAWLLDRRRGERKGESERSLRGPRRPSARRGAPGPRDR